MDAGPSKPDKPPHRPPRTDAIGLIGVGLPFFVRMKLTFVFRFYRPSRSKVKWFMAWGDRLCAEGRGEAAVAVYAMAAMTARHIKSHHLNKVLVRKMEFTRALLRF